MTSSSARKRRCKPAKRKPSKPVARRKKRAIREQTLQWRDVTLAVSYERDWMGMKDTIAHLQIRVLGPKGAVIPLTDTGYRSHFISSVYVDEAGGPLAYVRRWLESEAATPAWKRREQASRQLSLF
ncbi:MAG: hypothetical protein WDN01_16905 [Rhizomicrobium sp.]